MLELNKSKEDAYLQATSVEVKACKGCKFFSADKGYISRRKEEEKGDVFVCTVTQCGLSKEVIDLPEHCRAQNLVFTEDLGRSSDLEGRNNCLICNIMTEDKPACKQANVTYCPCKTCGSFMAVNGECMNFEKGCQERLKYDKGVEEKV